MDETLSLDQQIKEARRRAEEFHLNLQKTRKNEEEMLQIANEERKKWTKSYEDKTVMIEQLQRELASTVETLNTERKIDTSRTTYEDLEKKTRFEENLKELTPNTSNYLKNNLSSNRYNDWVPPSLPSASSVIHEYGQGGVNRSTTVPVYTSPHLEMNQQTIRRENAALKVELEQAKNAWKDSETKIQFYLSQIKHLELEINVQNQEKETLKEKMKILEKMNTKLENDVNILKSFEVETKKSQHDTISELQHTIEMLLNERERFEKTILSRDEEIKHLRENILRNEKDRNSWQENIKQLHQKEIELLQKQHEIQIKEISQTGQNKKDENQISSLLNSPVVVSKSKLEIGSRVTNQTQDDIDTWLNDLKAGNLDSDNEKETKVEGDEDFKSREFAIQPEKPPPRPPSSPSRTPIQKGPDAPIDNQIVSKKSVDNSMETPQFSSTTRDLTQTISSKKSTLSHSILDMQSFSPPRVLLSHQHGAYRDSLNGDVFLSKFKHQFLMPSSDLERQEFPTDLVSEASATGNDSIQLQSPERATNTIPTRTNKAHSSSKQSLQIRVPSGRSPKRLNQSPKLNQSTQIFDVVGYHLQPSDKKAEVSKEKKEIKRMVTNGIASKSPKSRSTSAPRHNPKISHLSPYNSRMSTISSSSLPNKSTKVSSTSTKEVRQVSPFPKPKSSVVQGSVVSTTPRPRSAPPRSQVSHLRKETNASSGAGSNFMVSNTSRQSKQSSQHHDASRGSKGKSRQSSSSSSNVKKGNEDINLSLNSDYPVWK